MGMNGKQFAALRGVDPSRVSQWKRQGRLVLDAEGKIDAEATNRLLDASLDQVKGLRRSGNVTSSAGAGAPSPASPTTPAGNGDLLQAGKQQDDTPPGGSARDDSGYWESRARREKAEAQMAEQKALQQAGALVAAAGVKKALSEIGRQVRNALQAIPDRNAAVLDPANPARAHKLLTDDINKVLRELSSQLEQHGAAVAGADEREAAVL